MILWITGNTGAGKTTLASWMRELNKGVLILDGDELRAVWGDLGFSEQDRWTQNIRTAKLARIFDLQGRDVIVSTICPYRDLRDEVKQICNCNFVYLDGGQPDCEETPYEKRLDSEHRIRANDVRRVALDTLNDIENVPEEQMEEVKQTILENTETL